MSTFSVESQEPDSNSRYVTPAYWLKDETAGSSIAVLPDRGGIITEWNHQDKELFFMDWDRYQDPKMSIRGGNPLLFPICGNLPDNQYSNNGVTYNLAQHGFARNMAWNVVDQGTTDCASLTLSLKSTPETLAVYPFEFEIKYTYKLKGNVLTIESAFTNLSDRPMPFSAGFHPYFPANDKSKLEFSIPATTAMVDQKTKATQAFDNQFNFDQDEIDWCFTQLTGQRATVIDRHAGTQLTLDYDAEYTTLVFWTLKGKDFYCLEPWSAARNAMNTGDHLLHIEPGATRSIQFSMTYNAIG
jgi:galactose mutarotase-like enzyme